MKIIKKGLAMLTALCIAASLFSVSVSAATVDVKNAVTLSKVVSASKTLDVNFSVPKGLSDITGIQFELTMPKGFTVEGATSKLASSWEVDENGTVFILHNTEVKSLESTATAVGGVYGLLTLKLGIASGTTDGKYTAKVKVVDVTAGEKANLGDTAVDNVFIYCSHKTTKTVGYKAATCTANGYSGDKVCSVCGVVITKGKTINKLSHKLTTKTTKATLSANGKIVTSCTVCKAVTSTKTISRIKTVKLSTTSYTYSGSAKKPSVTVKDYSGKTLKNGTDYTVSYKNNKSVGTATATVTFKGNYQGYKKLTFTIKPKTTSLSKLTAGKKQLKVTWKKNSAVSGYQIQYSTSKKFTSAKTVTVKGYKTTSKTIKSLKAKKTYYVRVRTYKTVNGKKVYSDWSAKALSKKTK